MKLLLDEQVPARLAREFPENYDVRTVQKMGWASTKNGELLKLAADCCHRASASNEQISRSDTACSVCSCLTRRQPLT